MTAVLILCALIALGAVIAALRGLHSEGKMATILPATGKGFHHAAGSSKAGVLRP